MFFNMCLSFLTFNTAKSFFFFLFFKYVCVCFLHVFFFSGLFFSSVFLVLYDLLLLSGQ